MLDQAGTGVRVGNSTRRNAVLIGSASRSRHPALLLTRIGYSPLLTAVRSPYSWPTARRRTPPSLPSDGETTFSPSARSTLHAERRRYCYCPAKYGSLTHSLSSRSFDQVASSSTKPTRSSSERPDHSTRPFDSIHALRASTRVRPSGFARISKYSIEIVAVVPWEHSSTTRSSSAVPESSFGKDERKPSISLIVVWLEVAENSTFTPGAACARHAEYASRDSRSSASATTRSSNTRLSSSLGSPASSSSISATCMLPAGAGPSAEEDTPHPTVMSSATRPAGHNRRLAIAAPVVTGRRTRATRRSPYRSRSSFQRSGAPRGTYRSTVARRARSRYVRS